MILDSVAHEVRRDGELIHLRPKEYQLLAMLAAHPGRAYTRRQLWFRPAAKTQWQPLHLGSQLAAGYGRVRYDQDGVLRVATWSGLLQYDPSEKQLNLALNIRIPNDYIPEENQRLRMYKRVAGVQGDPQLNEVRSEMEDRYGPLPIAVQNLVDYAALRILCQRVGANAIERKRDQFSIRFHQNAKIDPEKLARFVATNKGAQFSPAGILKFFSKASGPTEVLPELRNLLTGLAIREEVKEPAGIA